MGFISGVITGVALSAAAAAWYMSRSGESFRDQYRVEQRLGEIGDQLEARSREIQASLNTQLAEMRATSDEAMAESGVGERLDDAQASAAEVAAEAAAEAESVTKRNRKAGDD
jgi:gas vesicle protein